MELASRDIVARAIYEQMIQNDQPHVLLDISHRPPAEVLEHFPTIAARVRAAGFDMTKEAFPVAPVQHYMCGGVQVRPQTVQMLACHCMPLHAGSEFTHVLTVYAQACSRQWCRQQMIMLSVSCPAGMHLMQASHMRACPCILIPSFS